MTVAGLAIPLSAQAAEIYVYADANYSGASRHYLNDVRNLELEAFNDTVSSIRVISGVWSICRDASFGGRCEIVSGDVPNLNSTGLNDEISSLRVESSGSNQSRYDYNDGRGNGNNGHGNAYGREALTFFAETDFRGRQVRIDGDNEDLREFNFNDDASSLRVEGGSWEICDDRNFRGHCQTVTSNESNLGSLNLNNAVSSVRQIGDGYGSSTGHDYSQSSANGSALETIISWWLPARNDRWDRWESNQSYRAEVFENTNFRGNHREFNGAIPDFAHNGFNDSISSFRLEGRWQVCEHVNFGGECEIFRFDEENLVQSGWNDRISSMRPIGVSSRNRDGLLLFEDVSFQGDRERFSDSDPDLRNRGFNDTTSSLQVREGRWEVCEDTNYRGRCREVDSNQSNLISLSLNDRISSVRRLDNWYHDQPDQSGSNNGYGRGITIYEQANFGGRTLTFTADVPNLAPQNFNDILSSLRVHDGRWELCEDANYQGRCWNVQDDESNVTPLGFNDRISSMRHANNSGHQSSLVPAQFLAFQNANYGGSSRAYTGSVSDLTPDGWNDMISSFRISGPGQWEICEHASFGGRCQIFDGDESTLVPQNWNDKVSSVRYLP